MEESPYMFGSFEFYENAFRIHCVFFMNRGGLFVLDLPRWELGGEARCRLHA